MQQNFLERIQNNPLPVLLLNKFTSKKIWLKFHTKTCKEIKALTSKLLFDISYTKKNI